MSKENNYKWLIVQLVGWAMDNGCYRDEDGEIPNYFTVSKGIKGKPFFTGAFPEYKTNWPLVRKAAYEHGVYLCQTPRLGWFIGNAVDLGNTLSRSYKGNETRISNFDQELHYAAMIGNNNEMDMILNAFNSKRDIPITFEQANGAVREFFLAMGVPYQESFTSLLNAPLDNTEDE
jgi:hypothetical protein